MKIGIKRYTASRAVTMMSPFKKIACILAVAIAIHQLFVAITIHRYGTLTPNQYSTSNLEDFFHAEPEQGRRRQNLNPFRDIKLTSNDDGKKLYSSHHCVFGKGYPQNDEFRFVGRTCKFTNLYYNPQDEIFYYYPSPSTKNNLKTDDDLQKMMDSMSVSLSNVLWNPKRGTLKLKLPQQNKWRPEIQKNQSVPEKFAMISSPSNIAFLLYHPAWSFNFGHFIWDDVLSLFTMLDIFGLTTGLHEENDIFPLPFYVETEDEPLWRCNARSKRDAIQDVWMKCTRMFHKMFPSIFRYETPMSGDILRTGNWLKDISKVHGGSLTSNTSSSNFEKDWNRMLPDTSLVLIPTVLAGTGKHGQSSCTGDCAAGRASQLFSFRNFLIKNILYPNYKSIIKEKKIPAGYITFSLPGGSSRPEEVTFFQNIIPIAKEIYGEEKIKIVDMATITLMEEVILALDTAVLFVNHGGGSATSIFLPRDSSVFLYAAGKCEEPIWCDHGKNHFDSVFYESNGYIRPTWIHKNEREDITKIKSLLQTEFHTTIKSWGSKKFS